MHGNPGEQMHSETIRNWLLRSHIHDNNKLKYITVYLCYMACSPELLHEVLELLTLTAHEVLKLLTFTAHEALKLLTLTAHEVLKLFTLTAHEVLRLPIWTAHKILSLLIWTGAWGLQLLIWTAARGPTAAHEVLMLQTWTAHEVLRVLSTAHRSCCTRSSGCSPELLHEVLDCVFVVDEVEVAWVVNLTHHHSLNNFAGLQIIIRNITIVVINVLILK